MLFMSLSVQTAFAVSIIDMNSMTTSSSLSKSVPSNFISLAVEWNDIETLFASYEGSNTASLAVANLLKTLGDALGGGQNRPIVRIVNLSFDCQGGPSTNTIWWNESSSTKPDDQSNSQFFDVSPGLLNLLQDVSVDDADLTGLD